LEKKRNQLQSFSKEVRSWRLKIRKASALTHGVRLEYCHTRGVFPDGEARKVKSKGLLKRFPRPIRKKWASINRANTEQRRKKDR